MESKRIHFFSLFNYLFNKVAPSFAWLELVSHRSFMPKLLTTTAPKGWPLFQRLLVDLFKFMEPYLRNAELGEPVCCCLCYCFCFYHLQVGSSARLTLFPFLCALRFTFCTRAHWGCCLYCSMIFQSFFVIITSASVMWSLLVASKCEMLF